MIHHVPFFKGKKRRWYHKSVLALLQHGKNDEEPPDVIRRLARDLVNEALSLDWEGPPYNPETLASLRGIEIRKAANLRSEAHIIPKADGKLLIEYDPTKTNKRINFSICHEIAHTLFPDHYESTHNRNYQEKSHASELECLCDIGGAELLMPHESFLSDLSTPLALDTVRYLSERYQASSEAILIRIAQLSSQPCAVVFLSEKFKPTEQRESKCLEFDFGFPLKQPKLRVDYVQATEGFPVFIPPHKSVPEDSVAYECLTAYDIIEGTEKWDLNGFGLWTVQAGVLPISTDSARRVVALILPNEEFTKKKSTPTKCSMN